MDIIDNGDDPIGDLFAECADRVARVVYLMTGHERETARIVHAAFAGAGESWDALGSWPSTPEAWVRTQALRLAARPARELRQFFSPARPTPAAFGVLHALSALTPAQRAVVTLTHVAGLGAREIALETEATVGATAARLSNAESDLSGHPWAGDLGATLRAVAAGAEIPLAPKTAARALPRRRADHAVRIAAAGVAGLVLLPGVAHGLGEDTIELTSAAPPAEPLIGPVADAAGAGASAGSAGSAAAEKQRISAAEKALKARQAGIRDEVGPDVGWKHDRRPAEFLPSRDSKPSVTKVRHRGSDLGYVTKAFLHRDKVYVSVDAGADAKERIYRVTEHAEVVPGPDLNSLVPKTGVAARAEQIGPKVARGAAAMPLNEFLWLVGQKDTAVPLELRLNKKGRIIRIVESGP